MWQGIYWFSNESLRVEVQSKGSDVTGSKCNLCWKRADSEHGWAVCACTTRVCACTTCTCVYVCMCACVCWDCVSAVGEQIIPTLNART